MCPTQDTTGQSGGINIPGQVGTVGGSIVGRDAITHIHNSTVETAITGDLIQGVAGAGTVHVGIMNFYGRPAEQPAPARADAGPIPPCPYPGLAYFGPGDAGLFFGRDAAIQRLSEAVGRQSLTALVGASGTGKSSVVLAGLAPRLHQAGSWLFTYFRIGSELDRDPFRALARALVPLYVESNDATERLKNTRKLASDLQTTELTLRDVFADCRSRSKGRRILLIADQFEEAFTLVEDGALRQRFVDVLLAGFSDLAPGSGSDISLIFTLRADFYGRALQHRFLADALQGRVENLGPMNRDELQAAIVRPAEKAGVSFAPGLVPTVLDEVEGKPGSLPLLQFALREMWGLQENRTITRASYDGIGGVDGALARRAETIFGKLTDGGANAAMERAFRRLFTRLVTLGEGQQDTRRVVERQELDEEAWKLAQRLADEDNRLVVTSAPARTLKTGQKANPPVVARETVEVTHEALIRHWPQLVGWIDRDRAFQSWLRQIHGSMTHWLADTTDEGPLLRGGMLAQATDWLARRGDEFSSEERSYIEAGLALRQRVEDEREAARQEEIRRQQELAEGAERLRLEAEARTKVEAQARSAAERARGRLRGWITIVAVAFTVALVASAIAVVQRTAATKQLAMANRALAKGLWSELNLTEPLTPRQRNALWALALATPAVQRQFIDDIVTPPAELPRFISLDGRERVSRALGLGWPQGADAAPIFTLVLQQIGQTTDADALPALAAAVTALAPKLSEMQAQAALTLVLQQIGQTTDADALPALAAAVTALAPKLSEMQAQAALTLVLQQIGQTTDADALLALAAAVTALAPRLNDTLAQAALTLVLQQIGQTTDADALLALAAAVTALAPRLNDTQAQAALTPVLEQIGQTTTSFALGPLVRSLAALAPRMSETQVQAALTLVLQQIGQTTDADALPALAAAVTALAPRLNDTQAQAALTLVLQQIGQTTDADALPALAAAVTALAPRLNDTQAQAALTLVLQQIGRTTRSSALEPLVQSVVALAPRLSETQAQAALTPVLEQIGQTTTSFALGPLVRSLTALAPRLSETQVQAALTPVLEQIGQTTNADALPALAAAVTALAPKLSETQTQAALTPVLEQIGQTTDSDTLGSLAQSVVALAPRLNDTQAQAALTLVLQQLSRTTRSSALELLVQSVVALAPRLNDTQAQAALTLVLQQIGRTTRSSALEPLVQSVVALAPRLNDTQAQAALTLVLQQISLTTRSSALGALAQSVVALAPRLNDTQAQAALTLVLEQIGQTTSSSALEPLVQSVTALAPKLSETQAQAALTLVLQQIGQTTRSSALGALAQSVVALAPRLSETQAQAALTPVLEQIGQTTRSFALEPLVRSLTALAPKLSETQVQAALTPVLEQIGQTTNADALPALAAAVTALAPKLSETQAQAALTPMLQKIGQITDPDTLRALAEALEELAPRLSRTQLPKLRATLGWAPNATIVSSLAKAVQKVIIKQDMNTIILETLRLLKFPTLIDSATNVLLDGLQLADTRAPGKEAGLEANLAWIRAVYPEYVNEITGPPKCPEPPAGWTDLACPY